MRDGLVFAAPAKDPNSFMLGSSQLPISPASGDLTPSSKLQGQLHFDVHNNTQTQPAHIHMIL